MNDLTLTKEDLKGSSEVINKKLDALPNTALLGFTASTGAIFCNLHESQARTMLAGFALKHPVEYRHYKESV